MPLGTSQHFTEVAGSSEMHPELCTGCRRHPIPLHIPPSWISNAVVMPYMGLTAICSIARGRHPMVMDWLEMIQLDCKDGKIADIVVRYTEHTTF